jgi:hypothetical protein
MRRIVPRSRMASECSARLVTASPPGCDPPCEPSAERAGRPRSPTLPGRLAGRSAMPRRRRVRSAATESGAERFRATRRLNHNKNNPPRRSGPSYPVAASERRSRMLQRKSQRRQTSHTLPPSTDEDRTAVDSHDGHCCTPGPGGRSGISMVHLWDAPAAEPVRLTQCERWARQRPGRAASRNGSTWCLDECGNHVSALLTEVSSCRAATRAGGPLRGWTPWHGRQYLTTEALSKR